MPGVDLRGESARKAKAGMIPQIPRIAARCLRPVGTAATILGRRLRISLARLGRIGRLVSKFLTIARNDGVRPAIGRTFRKLGSKRKVLWQRFTQLVGLGGRKCSYFTPPPTVDAYSAWRRLNGGSPRRSEAFKEILEKEYAAPFFSILLPVYNTPIEFLDAAVRSVTNQGFRSWELILVDDASTDAEIRKKLESLAAGDHRIRTFFRQRNGNISVATNDAAEHARGEFLALLDHDDLLEADALAHLALHIERNPEDDLVYSDDDKIGETGTHHSPQFKPDWSPELLLSFCYTGHLTAVRTALYREVGGMRVGFEGSQDHDFWLRASERARHIGHIPQLLYHWRVSPGSTAQSGHAKPGSIEAGRRAVAEAFRRRGVRCEVTIPEWADRIGCGIFQPIMPDEGPSVAILIPTRNHAKILKRLVESLEKTTYRNYHVYIIDNESDDPATLRYLAGLGHRVLRIGNPGGRFSYAALNNAAVRKVDEDLILFLNDDTEVIEPRWLSQMVGWSSLPGVGSVGARLLFPDDRIQHAGIVHGVHEGLPGHAFRLLPWWDGGSMGLARVTRNSSAVTAACMLTPRALFLSLGGFDEENFAVAYNDADYGYRLLDAGYRNVLCAEAELYHHEGLSRGHRDDPREVARYRETHGRRIDPYLNPQLHPESETFKVKPTVVPLGARDRPIRLLAVSHNLNWEGAPKFQLELMIRLKESGCIDPTVLSPVEGPRRREYEEAGIPVRIADNIGGLNSEFHAHRGALSRLADMIRREGFELVHGNTLQSFWAIDAARLACVPSVWSVHESEPWYSYFNDLPTEIAASALSCFAHPYRVIFSASSSAAAWGDLETSRNYGLIRWALDIEQFSRELRQVEREEARARLGLAPDDLCILLLGTVCERKGQHDLLHAFRSMPREIAGRIQCFVVGARDSLEYSRKLRSLASKLQEDRRERFTILPETNHTAGFWKSADLFCCSSRIESYPHVVLEAMGCGLPVVTTPVYGISEQVRPGVNALIYKPGDTKTLAGHIDTLYSDSDLRRSMGEASTWVLRSLPTQQDMIDKYRKTFLAAVESSAGGGGGRGMREIHEGHATGSHRKRHLEPHHPTRFDSLSARTRSSRSS